MTRKIVNMCLEKANDAESKGDKVMTEYYLKQAEVAESKLPEICKQCTDVCPGSDCEKLDQGVA